MPEGQRIKKKRTGFEKSEIKNKNRQEERLCDASEDSDEMGSTLQPLAALH